MATLKDVAQRAGVSESTVSIIANGRQKERKISAATVAKVNAAIQALHYRPNVNARNLKYVSQSTTEFILFWPQDDRILMLSSILSGLIQKVQNDNFDCQIAVNLYPTGQLTNRLRTINPLEVQGLIIGGASKKDMADLKQLSYPIPIVLINRITDQFSSVNVNSQKLARTVLQLFKQHNVTEALTVGLTDEFQASNSRLKSFIDLAPQTGITIRPQFKLKCHNSFEDGQKIGHLYHQLKQPPHYIFVESDIVAIGMVCELSRLGYQANQDYNLIAVGTLESSRTLYNTPSISLIDIPSQKITAAAASILEKWNGKPEHILVDPVVMLRETFR